VIGQRVHQAVHACAEWRPAAINPVPAGNVVGGDTANVCELTCGIHVVADGE
jgi:hypothetical protein